MSRGFLLINTLLIGGSMLLIDLLALAAVLRHSVICTGKSAVVGIITQLGQKILKGIQL